MLPCDHRWRQNVVKTKKLHNEPQASVSPMFLPHFDVPRLLWSITEQTHGNMEPACFIQWSEKRKDLYNAALIMDHLLDFITCCRWTSGLNRKNNAWSRPKYRPCSLCLRVALHAEGGHFASDYCFAKKSGGPCTRCAADLHISHEIAKIFRECPDDFFKTRKKIFTDDIPKWRW